MNDQHDLQAELASLMVADDALPSVWNEPIVCRVEVDLPGWLTQLAGVKNGKYIAKMRMRPVSALQCEKKSQLKHQKLRK